MTATAAKSITPLRKPLQQGSCHPHMTGTKPANRIWDDANTGSGNTCRVVGARLAFTQARVIRSGLCEHIVSIFKIGGR